MSLAFLLNKKPIELNQQQSADLKSMPLLWFIRETAGLKGTKFGCGIGQCGACTVHLNGEAVRSCSISLGQVNGTSITTIEGLAPAHDKLNVVQEAWLDIDVPQCGYCQPGQIMTAASMLAKNPKPSDDYISQQHTNICRCGTYIRIRKAIKLAAKKLEKSNIDS